MKANNYSKKHLIGLAGKMGVGKTTIAKWFEKHQNFKRLYFSKPMKDCCPKLLGLPEEYFTDQKLKEKEIPGLPKMSPRKIMQLMGTEFLRNMVYYDFFIWRMRLYFSEYSDQNIIVDDIRFENEAKLIRDNGGLVVHLNREFIQNSKNTQHTSEKGINIDPYDIIYNIDKSEEKASKCLYRLIYSIKMD